MRQTEAATATLKQRTCSSEPTPLRKCESGVNVMLWEISASSERFGEPLPHTWCKLERWSFDSEPSGIDRQMSDSGSLHWGNLLSPPGLSIQDWRASLDIWAEYIWTLSSSPRRIWTSGLNDTLHWDREWARRIMVDEVWSRNSGRLQET